jgi:hypothetical protein
MDRQHHPNGFPFHGPEMIMQNIGTPDTTSTMAEEFRRLQQAAKKPKDKGERIGAAAERLIRNRARIPNSNSESTEPTPKPCATQTPHDISLTSLRPHMKAVDESETRTGGEAPKGTSTQTQHGEALTLQRQQPEAPGTAGTATEKTKGILPVKMPMTPAQATRETVAATGHDVKLAVAKALAHVLRHGHGVERVNPDETEDGFESDGSWLPNGHHARAFTFARAVLHCPALSQYHGDGCGLFRCLKEELGNDRLGDLLSRLGCSAEHLVFAASKPHTLLGDDLVASAARNMASVVIPQHFLVEFCHHRIMLAVVRLVGALAELKCIQTGDAQPTVYLSGESASRALGIPKAECSRALRLAVHYGVVELVKQGHRKHRNAKGTASEYRLAWCIGRVSIATR